MFIIIIQVPMVSFLPWQLKNASSPMAVAVRQSSASRRGRQRCMENASRNEHEDGAAS
jgi:hypothetical protein